MQRSRTASFCQAALASAAGISLLVSPPLGASVKEAHSFAMEAASEHVDDGFVIRGEPWTGTLAAGSKKVIRHQLFRGNEYWFWLGTPSANAGLMVKIYDRKGRPVHVETTSGHRWAGARVLPPKTGTYLIVVSCPPKPEAKPIPKFDWSMSYGFH